MDEALEDSQSQFQKPSSPTKTALQHARQVAAGASPDKHPGVDRGSLRTRKRPDSIDGKAKKTRAQMGSPGAATDGDTTQGKPRAAVNVGNKARKLTKAAVLDGSDSGLSGTSSDSSDDAVSDSDLKRRKKRAEKYCYSEDHALIVEMVCMYWLPSILL